MKKISLEEHFVPPEYTEYVRGQQIQGGFSSIAGGNLPTEALICALLALGADHILFSADYPFVQLQEVVQFIEIAPISEAVREKICHLNAERLLKL